MNEAEATVLQLFEARLKPSREQKLQFRRAVMLLRQLDGADLRLARFWLDYKVGVLTGWSPPRGR